MRLNFKKAFMKRVFPFFLSLPAVAGVRPQAL